ncbi:class I SAM-dependent methyltransferase [Planctomicrobium sp. SH668]|uniref:class I SAM-dependent methyltransferase n=1 Tax=Planctomicrobium sp. SH668 TaxID=3448126 RepID=UPI003F5CB394
MNQSPLDSDSPNPAPSAFPTIPGTADVLPEIPGGWTPQEIRIADQTIRMYRPGDPDLFLDDEQVHAENAKNDYMPYWAFLWPSSIKMAARMFTAPWPVGTKVLELGAGIGLVGLAAQLRGDSVTYSDYDQTALHICRFNAVLNGLSDPEVMQLDWREIPEIKFPVLVGCEVTYDATLHEPLLLLIQSILTQGGECWLGDPGRFQAPYFYKAAKKLGFSVEIEDEQGTLHPEPLSNQFQIFKLKTHPAS